METKKHLVFPLIFILFALTGQSLAQDKAALEEKVKKLSKKLSEKMVKGEFSTEHYAQDAISMPNNSPMVKGIEAIKASMKQMEQSGMKFESFTTTPTEIMVNGNMVTEIGTYSLSMKAPNMPSSISDNGKYLTIWEVQDDGNLKIKVETWNTDRMPQQY